ncbi:acetamidase/formamidase family protein [Paenibacillus sp. 481]|uniref:acetamidase/formamidase family protein n=1 Tax=Paenibacillus sp. 481 TaxID=2835869 RepID=UPI001E5E4A34|nr:acetamidase/formamidase family protein [Paenibacillus sp. 481]UHA72751.1 acetamidase/formamidase family protein [Paenibacillus sp. 481]
MTVQRLKPERKNLYGTLSKEYDPILTIQSGDSVQMETLDAGWGYYCQETQSRKKFEPLNKETDRGHALIGPIWINGAKPGMTLEVRINDLIPGPYGFTCAGQYANWQNVQLGLTQYEEITLKWQLDNKTNIGTCTVNDRSFSVGLKPFMGILGMPPDEPGKHLTWTPRYCGGNLDCKELVKGSTLYLPIPVEGGMFFVGDGHAAQGDGEVSCQAIECPMELVDLTFQLREDMPLTLPRANTPAGWLTFGLHEDLNEATVQALDGMLELMGELYGVNRVEAMALGSAVIDLRVTQIVNGVKGVHACLPHGALR